MKKHTKVLLSNIVVLFVFIAFFIFSRNDNIEEVVNEDSILQVHFIDVGQADSMLIESNNEYMLVDGGNNDDSQLIVSYLQREGVSRLEYVIGTHPHEDHIGSLDVIIQEFDIGKVIMPPVVHSSKTFEDVLDAIEDKELKITKPVVGTSYTLGDADFMIIAPNEDYGKDLNNWSVGIKLNFGDNSFIMCGDVEEEAEEDIIASGIDMRADVYKVNHHGSSTSNSSLFLDAVNPTYAIITSEEGNSYGHPHKEVMDDFKERGIHLFRTDIQGTIIATSDGRSVTWNKEPSDNLKGGSSE